MIDYELDQAHSILRVRPESSLDKSDFAELAKVVDPEIEAGGALAGLIIDAPHFPGWDSFGALVSLAYNRGASFSAPGDRYREMRAIHDHMASGRFDKVPDEFRSMKRLWPNMAGLRNRRDHEADLFAKGLAATPAP